MMDYNHAKLPINNESDLVHARLRVRETARRIGMTLMDQSRISMATSSLANALGLGRDETSIGFVLIEKVVNHTKIGLRVTCSRSNCEGFTPPLSYFNNERWMVDELELQSASPEEVQVSLTKWATF
jgi:anti-sigma regulatory factor (Ser/Thr protein kinase)